jgi:hypothetical protein
MIVVTLVRSDVIPVPYRINETSPHNSSNGYATHRPNTDRHDAHMTPPTTGWDPWQGSWPRDLPDWRKALTPTIGVVALSFMKRPGERWPRAATYYGYDAPGNPETTSKTTKDVTLHRATDEPSPWLQCCHASTVASRQTLLRRGHKTMTTTTPRRASEDGVACKPS